MNADIIPALESMRAEPSKRINEDKTLTINESVRRWVGKRLTRGMLYSSIPDRFRLTLQATQN